MDHPIFLNKLETLAQKIAVARSLPPNEKEMLPHTNRVKQWAVWLAVALGFLPEQVSLIRYAAILHDIGKFRPDMRPLFFEVPGEFTKEQRKKAKVHAHYSASIVREFWQKWQLLPEDWMVCPVVLLIEGHHDNFVDLKREYKRRLMEGEFQALVREFAFLMQRSLVPKFEDLDDLVLQGSQILKTADYYATRIRGRHFVAAISEYDAYDEIVKRQGIEFDPKVVQVLGKLLCAPPSERRKF